MDSFFLPVKDPREVYALLDEIPVAVDREDFVKFVLGFPRRYLHQTPRHEIVKHYLLSRQLGTRKVITSLSANAEAWKLVLIAGDQPQLFSKIAGSLSCFGADIFAAEAFANASSLVLDSFQFHDHEGRFVSKAEVARFQHFLEAVVEGKTDLRTRMRERWSEVRFPQLPTWEAVIDQELHPNLTRVRVKAPDHFGLLFVLSHTISRIGLSIEQAYMKITAGIVGVDFYITRNGEKLDATGESELRSELERLRFIIVSEDLLELIG